VTAPETQNRPILVLHETPGDFDRMLEERFPDLEFRYVVSGDRIKEALAEHDPEIVFAVTSSAFPRACYQAIVEHPGLKWLQVGGSGYDHLPAWDRGKLQISHCAGVLARNLAETITGAMLALNGHFLRYRTLQSIAEWRPIPFRPLEGQTLLVVGFGAIGQRLAHNARALGMKVLATRQTPAEHPLADEVHGPDRQTLLSLLPRADVVSLHLRFDETTRHSFDEEAFAAMKRGSMFINTSRGKVVESEALVAALKSGHLMGAYLDVFETEPLPPADPLWQAPNTLITPHTADNVIGYATRYASFFADNLAKYLAGAPVQNLIR
jgi:phosphoglycerate dehydrogenase-like enzyme